ncbi:MAG: hypothetical protein KBF93_21060 [Leptospiraceae bacterium]|nr:hypothetical protein [Leptospiraceae bacterium]
MNQTLTLDKIREKGINALSKELSATELARFFQMFEKGEGDFTLERKKFYKNKSVDDIYKEVLASRKSSKKKVAAKKYSKPIARKRKVA